MKKIDIIDCCNLEHKISLLINDDRMDFVDDVYFAIESEEGLSLSQVQKLEDFRLSCNGPIMVKDYFFNYNNARYMCDKSSNWVSINLYEADGFVFAHYRTTVQGDRDFVMRLSKDEYKGLDDVVDFIHWWKATGDCPYKVIWIGHKIN